MEDECINLRLDFDVTIAPNEKPDTILEIDTQPLAQDPDIRKVYRIAQIIESGISNELTFLYDHEIQCLLPPGFHVEEPNEQVSTDCKPESNFTHNITWALLEARCPRLSVTIRLHAKFLLMHQAFAGEWVSEPRKIDLLWKDEGGVVIAKLVTKEGLDFEVFTERWQEQLERENRRVRNWKLRCLSILFIMLILIMCP